MARELDTHTIEATTPQDCNDANDAALTLDAAQCNVASNAAPEEKPECNTPAPEFPASKRATARAMGLNDVTVGRWCAALEKQGVRVLNSSNKVTEDGYTRLVALKQATQDRGTKLSDYLDTLTPDAPTDEPETVDAELVDESPLPTQDDGSQYAMVVSQQQDAVAITGARLDLRNQELMESLQTIAKAKREKDALQADVSANKRRKWQSEVLADLSEEFSFKAKCEAEMREKLGL